MAIAIQTAGANAIASTAGEAFIAGDLNKPIAVSLDGSNRVIKAASPAAIVGVIMLTSTVALNGAITYYSRVFMSEVDLPNIPQMTGVYGFTGGLVALDKVISGVLGRLIGQVMGRGNAQGNASDTPGPIPIGMEDAAEKPDEIGVVPTSNWGNAPARHGNPGATVRPGCTVSFNIA